MMYTTMHIFSVVFVAGLALMGLAFAAGNLIAWYKNRKFMVELERMSNEP